MKLKTIKENRLPVTISDLPQGPAISGTVTVPLIELDKMRADHSNLKKIAEDLLSTQKSVRIVVEERKVSTKYVSNHYGSGGHWVSDPNYTELLVENKGLDEVTDILRKEANERVKTTIENLENLNEQLKEELKKLTEKSTLEIMKLKADYSEKENDLKNVETIKKALENQKDINSHAELKYEKALNENKKLQEELHKLRYAKSAWYRFWH